MSLPLIPFPSHPPCAPARRPCVVVWDQPLYKRTKNATTALDVTQKWVWFSPVRGYGSADSYGRYVHEWVPNTKLHLLDVSSEDRTWIARELGLTADRVNCDEQYSGGLPNIQFHDAIDPILVSMGLDGTFALEQDPSVAEDGTCGVSEIVLGLSSIRNSLRYTGNITIVK